MSDPSIDSTVPEDISAEHVQPQAPAAALPTAPPTPEQMKAALAQALPFRHIQPAFWMAPYLDERGLPAGIPSFNLGAFFWPLFWAAAYGMWNWALLAFAVNILSNNLARLVPGPAAALIVLVQLGFAAWFAGRINRAYWAVNPKGLTPEQFRAKQPKWTIVGGILFVVVEVGLFVVSFLAAA